MASKSSKRYVLVTGASGFVGKTFLRRAADQLGDDIQFIAADHLPSDFSEHIALDITDPVAIDNVIGKLRPYGVLHLAAISAIGDADRDVARTWAVNATATIDLALAVLRHAPEARFIFVSTAEVYGGSFSPAHPLDEQAPLAPLNVYAASKAAAELMIGQLVRAGLHSIRFRPFNHTGPGQSEKFVVPAFASQLARIELGLAEPILRTGNLESRRDFLDVRDVVDAYIAAFLPTREIQPGTVFNLASGIPRRIGDILNELCKRLTIPIQIEPDPARTRASEVPTTWGSAALAHEHLGWKPQIPWEETIKDTLDGCRAAARGR